MSVARVVISIGLRKPASGLRGGSDVGDFFSRARDAFDDDRPPTRTYARIRARKSSSTQKSVRVSANLFGYICYKVGLVSACVRISGMLCKQRTHKWLACARRVRVLHNYASTCAQTAYARGTRAHTRTATRSRI